MEHAQRWKWSDFALILNYSYNQRVPQVMSINKRYFSTYARFKSHLINILHLSINKNLHHRNIYQPTDGMAKLQKSPWWWQVLIKTSIGVIKEVCPDWCVYHRVHVVISCNSHHDGLFGRQLVISLFCCLRSWWCEPAGWRFCERPAVAWRCTAENSGAGSQRCSAVWHLPATEGFSWLRVQDPLQVNSSPVLS